MFARLFAESGLSLERLRALVEVGAAGSIAQAAAGDPVRQSQYSRQIKELEDFFHAPLLERQGKGMRFTGSGRELARISRFFLLGLSNFQRGCLAEERTYRIGGCATFIQTKLLPLLAEARNLQTGVAYDVEALPDEAVERRLHELTLDFGIVTNPTLSRPLQSKVISSWRLKLWIAPALKLDARRASKAFREKRLPFVLAAEVPASMNAMLGEHRPKLGCDTFVEAREILRTRVLAAVLPDFLMGTGEACGFVSIGLSGVGSGRDERKREFSYRLAWNPRLLRLNPQAGRRRDFLEKLIAGPTADG